MKLSNSEKLILIMLCGVQKKLGLTKNDGVDPDFISSAIHTDNTWAVEWQYPGIFSDSPEQDPPEVTEVLNYLDMWQFIEEGFDKLSTEEKSSINSYQAKFIGFDGNNESEFMSIARFFINDLERFQHFKGRDLNSHSPKIGLYRRMYMIFEPIRRTLYDRSLSKKELELILNAN